MSDLEAEMAKALNGKFFWEPTTVPNFFVCKEVDELRGAQRQHATGAVNVITARVEKDKSNVNSIKPITRKLTGRTKAIEPVLRAISVVYDVAVDDLLARSTSRYHARAKTHLYWALFRYIPGMSYPEAGRILDKCHSTVLHGKKLFEKNPDKAKIAEVDKLMGTK